MERLASCPSPHLLSICHPERSRRDPLRGGNPAAPNFRPLYLVILSEVRRRPNEVKDLCTPTYPFNCLKRDSSYRANSVMRGRASHSPILSLACHPERSEAAAERSRKLALSEVEGPLVWSHSPAQTGISDQCCSTKPAHDFSVILSGAKEMLFLAKKLAKRPSRPRRRMRRLIQRDLRLVLQRQPNIVQPIQHAVTHEVIDFKARREP